MHYAARTLLYIFSLKKLSMSATAFISFVSAVYLHFAYDVTLKETK